MYFLCHKVYFIKIIARQENNVKYIKRTDFERFFLYICSILSLLHLLGKVHCRCLYKGGLLGAGIFGALAVKHHYRAVDVAL